MPCGRMCLKWMFSRIVFICLYQSGCVIVQDEGLRIAWQYRKYFGDERNSSAENRGDTLILLFPLILV
jgi:hypothetical protein